MVFTAVAISFTYLCTVALKRAFFYAEYIKPVLVPQ